jgi:hypothetical protein
MDLPPRFAPRKGVNGYEPKTVEMAVLRRGVISFGRVAYLT